MAVRLSRRNHLESPAPLVLPEGGQPLESSPEVFRSHPLHRRAETAVDGARLLVRPVLPTDAAAIDRFVRRLSPETAYRRFQAGISRLTSAQLAGLVDVDHHDRETLLAFTWPRRLTQRRGSRTQSELLLQPSGRRQRASELVAVAQYVRVAGDRADMAIVVDDAWQRRGVGRLLARHLGAAAAEAGIVSFDARVLADNPAPQRLARSLSGTVGVVGDGTTLDLHIPLGAPRPTALTGA